jgi:phosphate transport system protein
LDKGLKQLEKVVIEMADLAVKTVEASIIAYLEGGSVEVQVRAWSDTLRHMHNEVEEISIGLIARQQPVATDLRTIMSSIKIAYDLSRFGRYAYDISNVLELVNGFDKTNSEDKFVKDMSDKVQEMLKLTIEIYNTKNFDKVKHLSTMENEVDVMYRNHLRSMSQRRPNNPGLFISEILVTRHLERIADHACYIVEEVHYMVHGEILHLR